MDQEMERLMMQQARGGGMGMPRGDHPTPDKYASRLELTIQALIHSVFSGEVIHISSLALLKVRVSKTLFYFIPILSFP